MNESELVERRARQLFEGDYPDSLQWDLAFEVADLIRADQGKPTVGEGLRKDYLTRARLELVREGLLR